MKNERRDRRVLAISSLPAVGSAGLKNIIGVLGTRVIPVPSLLISGLGNMAGHKRFVVPFRDLLHEAMRMAEEQGFELVLYTGYLSTPEQVDDILELIDDYRHQIHAVVVDPVCGDGGKPYVSENLIHSFDRLLKIADVATPNRTELALVQGLSVENDVSSLIDAFVKRYPSIALITTGVLWEREIGNYLTLGDHTEVLRHSMEVDRLLSGTGDL
ncbi:MAG: bifunctional hydroxymethylpyrimidine kinase/phosphomethylpyrimidine kinase, partial [Bacteroidota bacterium]